MQELDFEGCERIRGGRKKRCFNLDLVPPSRKRKRATDVELRKHLAEAVQTERLCCVRRPEEGQAPFESARSKADFAKAKRLYLDAGAQSGTVTGTATVTSLSDSSRSTLHFW